jgi:hypothetical protein
MASLLIHDLIFDNGPKCPKNRTKFGIDNTIELFRTQAAHGGLWRAGYQIDSIGEFCALVHFLGGPQLFPFIFYTLSAVFAYFCATKFF